MTTETVSRADYEALQARLAELEEDIEDLVALRVAQTKNQPEDYLPVELVKRMVDGEHPVRIWREHRGMTMQQLAAEAGVPQSYVSEIETRKKPGSVAALKKIAGALGISLDDMIE